MLRDAWGALLDLVLPASCAGCGADSRTPVCSSCTRDLSAAAPRRVAPTPAPPGLPPCLALDEYGGVLRELILAYKERGRHDLAVPLGALLAAVISAGTPRGTRLALVPVPGTAAASRQRFGDHMLRLTARAARVLGASGWPALVLRPVRAAPRPDSAGLDTAARARAAQESFRVRRAAADPLRRALGAGARVVLVDDIVTTGATLVSVADRLRSMGAAVELCALLAATPRRVVRPESDLTRAMRETSRNGFDDRDDAAANRS